MAKIAKKTWVWMTAVAAFALTTSACAADAVGDDHESEGDEHAAAPSPTPGLVTDNGKAPKPVTTSGRVRPLEIQDCHHARIWDCSAR